MTTTLTISDTTIGGDSLNDLLLEINSEYITIAELIRERLKAEIEKQKDATYKAMLVVSELRSSFGISKKVMKIDLEKQLKIAEEAFRNNQFFILIGDRQAESLEESICVGDIKQPISFIKLTQLVGG
ncbi:MAG: hypothetical protein ACJA1A_003321 [Saprospiraceae bacterium]|jgi:hypothetical protein|tara:strand:+ start:1650 stop:2033 length:384 start_codon:yes stop_codon:yes gene_type:complete